MVIIVVCTNDCYDINVIATGPQSGENRQRLHEFQQQKVIENLHVEYIEQTNDGGAFRAIVTFKVCASGHQRRFVSDDYEKKKVSAYESAARKAVRAISCKYI